MSKQIFESTPFDLLPSQNSVWKKMFSDWVSAIKGWKASTLKKTIFDITPFGSLPSQNSFEDNDIR